jgi:hypothetical protein
MAAHRTSRIKPGLAIGRASVERLRPGWIRTPLGVAATAGGFVCAGLAASLTGEDAANASLGVVMLFMLAVALLGPLVARACAALFGLPLRGRRVRLARGRQLPHERPPAGLRNHPDRPRDGLATHVTNSFDTEIWTKGGTTSTLAKLGTVLDRGDYTTDQSLDRELSAWANPVMAAVPGGFAAVAAVNTLVMTVLDLPQGLGFARAGGTPIVNSAHSG